jgi:hypothetical protein
LPGEIGASTGFVEDLFNVHEAAAKDLSFDIAIDRHLPPARISASQLREVRVWLAARFGPVKHGKTLTSAGITEPYYRPK